MKPGMVVSRLSALAQQSRLAVFRLLVQAGPEGLCVSDIASHLKVAAPTLSFHLKELVHSGLIKARQDGRFIYYSADFKSMNDLVTYLTENCCGGRGCEVESPACDEVRAKPKSKAA